MKPVSLVARLPMILSVALLFVVVAPARSQMVRITEVMANPSKDQGAPSSGEFVELVNLGAEPVDLSKWRIADRDAVDTIQPLEAGGPTVLAPGDFAVILDPDPGYSYTIPPDVLLLRPDDSAIGNSLSIKDPIRLLNEKGEIVDTFTPPLAARNGVSFERVDFGGPDEPGNWHTSYDPSGTTIGRPSSEPPDEPTSQPPPENLEGLIVINELLFRPETDAPEWVELYNRADVDVTTLGWTLADSRERPVNLPTATIPSKGYVILTRNKADFRAAHPDTPDKAPIVEMPLPALNDDGDSLTLRSANGTILDKMNYGTLDARRGQSLERRDPALDSGRMDNWILSVNLKGSTPGRENSVRYDTGPEPLIEATPNPFDPDIGPVQLRFDAPLSAAVTLRVFNSAGQLVKVLLDNAPNGGRQTIEWDGHDDQDDALDPGIYIVQLFTVTNGKPRATALALVLGKS